MKTKLQVVFTVTGEIDEELRVAPRVHKALRDLMQQIDVMPAYSGLDEKAIADRFKSDDGLTIKIDVIRIPTAQPGKVDTSNWPKLMQKCLVCGDVHGHGNLPCPKMVTTSLAQSERQANPNIDQAMNLYDKAR